MSRPLITFRVHAEPQVTPARLEEALAGHRALVVHEVGDNGRWHYQGIIDREGSRAGVDWARNLLKKTFGVRGNGAYSVGPTKEKQGGPDGFQRYLCKGPNKERDTPPHCHHQHAGG